MGLYATLLDAYVACPRCGAACTDAWQFHFGAVSEIPSYHLGDTIRWDEWACFGDPSMTLVCAMAYSVADPACSGCGLGCIIAELLIRDGVLIELNNPTACHYARELLLEGERRVPRYGDELYKRCGRLS